MQLLRITLVICYFQVGNDDEVLYLAAKSLDDMDNWMKEIKSGKTVLNLQADRTLRLPGR